MAIRLRLLLLVFLFATTSCSDDSNNDLSVTVSPDTTFLLPGNLEFTDTEDETECYTSEISEYRLSFDFFETTWKGEGSFLPVAVGIRLFNGGIEEECVMSVSGDVATLGQMLGYNGTKLVNSGDSTTATNLCPVLCGSFSEPVANLSYTAEVKLIGIQIKNDNSQIPISATKTIVVQGLDL